MAEPEWLTLQKKIFARYINQKFKGNGVDIKVQGSELIESFKDGIVFTAFLEVLSGKTFHGKPKAPAKQRIQHIDNVSKVIEFMTKECGIKTQTSAENIVDGNDKLVMGMIFQIIIKYMKLDEDDVGASSDIKEALLLWLKNRTQGYANVSIENFTKSFHDGLAFCALIHKLRPKLIPYDTLQKEEKIANLNLALDTAAKYCNVEKYLEPEDILKLDDLSMVVYLNDWYYGIALLQQQDAGARRIGKLVNITQTHDRMRLEYSEKSKKLIEWVDSKNAKLNDHTYDNTLTGIKEKLAEFYTYKAKEKGEKITEHMDDEALFHDLQLRLRQNQRPAFEPPAGQNLEALNQKFKELETAENNRSAALAKELARQIKLDKAAKRFHADVEKFFVWIAEKLKYLENKEEVDSVPKASLHLNILASYHKEYESAKVTTLASLKKLAEEIVADNYHLKHEIQAKEAEAEKKYHSLVPFAEKKQKDLEDALAREKYKEKLRLDFVNAAIDFQQFAHHQIDAASNTYFGDNLETVQAFGVVLDEIDAKVKSEADAKKQSYDAVQKEIEEWKVNENGYTSLTHADLVSLRGKLDSELVARRKAYEAELSKQKDNDALEREFAEKINGFNQWLLKAQESIVDKNGQLEEQLQLVNAAIADTAPVAKLAEISEIDEKLQKAEIVSKYTNSTSNDVQTSYQQYTLLLGKRKILLEVEIDNAKRNGVTEEQLKEIQENFKHFDKGNKGALERKDFRLCLQSLGLPATPADVDATLTAYDKDKNGVITFDEFIDFMKKRLGDTNTKEEIIQSFFLINQRDYLLADLMGAVVNETTFKEDQLTYLKAEMSPENDGYDYKTWTDAVFAR